MAKLLLPIMFLVMIFSYQNCAESFDPYQQIGSAETGSNNNGNSNGDSNVDNPPDEIDFDYSSLRAHMSATSVKEDEVVHVSISTEEKPLHITIRHTCPGGNLQSSVATACGEFEGYCSSFSCANDGDATVTASAYDSKSNQDIIIAPGTMTLTVLSLEKEQLANAINIQVPNSATPNSQFAVTANIDSRLLNDDDYSATWSISPSNDCSMSSPTNQSARFHCSKAGMYSVKLIASSKRYQAESSKSVLVGNPNLNLGISLSSQSIDVGVEYAISISGVSGLDIAGFNWSIDGNDQSSCSLKNSQTSGIQNVIYCSQIPVDERVGVNVSVSNDNFFVGNGSKNIDVDRGAYSLSIQSLSSVDSGVGQNLSVNVAKYHVLQSGNESVVVSSYSDLVFKWTVCIGSNGVGTEKIISGTNQITAADTACSSSGTKKFKVEVTSENYEGTTEKSVTITQRAYTYYWSNSSLPYVVGRNVLNMCRNNYPSGTCSSSNLGATQRCCLNVEADFGGIIPKLGTESVDVFCTDAVEYKCSAR